MDKETYDKIEKAAKWRLHNAMCLVESGVLTGAQYEYISQVESEKVRNAEIELEKEARQ